jgi:hypothetical protein
MRKCTFTTLVFCFITLSAAAQDYTIGIKFGPNITYSKASNGTNFGYEGDSKLDFFVGAFVDYQFKENYHFNLGLMFSQKTIGVFVNNNQSPSNIIAQSSFKQEHIFIPILLKLYTNEIFLDTKLYFNFGIVPQIRLSNTMLSESDDVIRELVGFDLAGNFGGGLERHIGVNTRVFAGIFFNLGFINQIKTLNPAYEDFTLKNRMVALEMGIKF